MKKKPKNLIYLVI